MITITSLYALNNTHLRTALITGCAVAGLVTLGLITRYHEKISKQEMRKEKAAEILAARDDLATDYVEVPVEVMIDWTKEAESLEERTYVAQEGEEEVEIKTRKSTPMDALPLLGKVSYDKAELEVKNFRVVRKHNRVSYTATLVADCKNRFGTPSRNHANVLAVRRFLLDAMKTHGVRPTMIAQMLPLAIEMVFIKSDDEMEAERVAAACQSLCPKLFTIWCNLWGATFGKRPDVRAA